MKRIVDIKDDSLSKYLLLSEEIKDLELSGLPKELLDFNLLHQGIPTRYMLKLTYEHLAVDEVLKQIMPKNAEIPSSFEQAGLPYYNNIFKLQKYLMIKSLTNCIINQYCRLFFFSK